MAGTLNRVLQETLLAGLCFAGKLKFSLPCFGSRQPLPLHLSFQELPMAPQTPCNMRCQLLMSAIPRKVQPTTRPKRFGSGFLARKGRADVYNSSVFKIHASGTASPHTQKSLLPLLYWRMQWPFFPQWKEKPVVNPILWYIKYYINTIIKYWIIVLLTI